MSCYLQFAVQKGYILSHHELFCNFPKSQHLFLRMVPMAVWAWHKMHVARIQKKKNIYECPRMWSAECDTRVFRVSHVFSECGQTHMMCADHFRTRLSKQDILVLWGWVGGAVLSWYTDPCLTIHIHLSVKTSWVAPQAKFPSDLLYLDCPWRPWRVVGLCVLEFSFGLVLG